MTMATAEEEIQGQEPQEPKRSRTRVRRRSRRSPTSARPSILVRSSASSGSLARRVRSMRTSTALTPSGDSARSRA